MKNEKNMILCYALEEHFFIFYLVLFLAKHKHIFRDFICEKIMKLITLRVILFSVTNAYMVIFSFWN